MCAILSVISWIASACSKNRSTKSHETALTIRSELGLVFVRRRASLPHLLIFATNLTDREYFPSVRSPLSSSLPLTMSFSTE